MYVCMYVCIYIKQSYFSLGLMIFNCEDLSLHSYTTYLNWQL